MVSSSLQKYSSCLSRALNIIFITATVLTSALAEAKPWEPSAGNTQIPLWPGKVPNARPLKGPENELTQQTNSVAGKPWFKVANVVHPTLTVYSPKSNNTGAAIVVFPGGGYQVLAIDLEGTEICDWLTAKEITCVLLKYRVPDDGRYNERSGPYPKSSEALQDAQRAIGLVRRGATNWKINPNKIGVIGFSAGGHLVAAISTHFKKRLYPKVDSADDESCRPDFAMAIYPGHLSANYKKDLSRLNPDIFVTNETPPTFLLHAQDDSVDPVEYSLLYYAALRKAKVPVEMHLFAQGGHAFGLRRTEKPITNWADLAETWLKTSGMILR